MAAISGVCDSPGSGGRAAGNGGPLSNHLEIRLSEPLSIYPALLADYKTGITRRGVQGSDDSSFLLGTGPFRLASYRGGSIILERNEQYWKGASALLDAIEFRAGLSGGAIAGGLRSGELDLARDLSPQDLEEFMRDPRFRNGIVEAPRKNTYFVLFNSLSGPLARNQKVRRALSGVVRTRDLVWQTLGRFAEPAVCLIHREAGARTGKRRHR